MKEEQVVFYSGGERVVGDLYLPDAGKGEPGPAVVQGPGWMGLRTARLYRPYHRVSWRRESRSSSSTTEGAGTPMATRWGSRPADNWRISPTP